MAESLYTGITVQGLYSDQTGDQLFGVVGSPVPASALYIAGSDGTNLRAISVDATGKVNVNATITPPSDNVATGTLTNPGDTVTVSTSGTSALMVLITLGAAITAGNVVFEVSLDGTNFISASVYPVFPDGNPPVSTTTTAGQWQLPVGGVQKFRTRASAGFTGGPATVTLTAGQGQYSVLALSDNYANFLATVTGNKTNNNAASNGTNVATLPAIATTAAPTYTTGNVVALSTDTAGSLRVSQQGTVTVTGTVSATQGTSPWVEDLTQVAGVTLGATAVTAFGTAPAAANVPGVNASIYAGTTGLTATGSSLNTNVTNTVTVTVSGTATVAGSLTNNNAAPGANNLGVLGFIAETAYNTVTYTTGNQVLAVTDLHGAINNDMQAVAGVQLGATAVTAFGTAPAAANVQGVNASIYAGTTGITATGTSLNVDVTNTVTVNQGTSPWVVAGNKTNNNAAPSTDNVGVLPALIESGAFPAVTLPAYNAGDLALVSVTQGASLRVMNSLDDNQANVSYYSVDNGITQKSLANATITPLLSIQSNSTAFKFTILEVQGFTDGTLNWFALVKNPQTLTGAAFTTTGIPTGSHIKIDTSATAVTIGTGTVVWSGYASATPILADKLLMALAAGAPGDTYTLVAEKFGTGTAKVTGQIMWRELAASI